MDVQEEAARGLAPDRAMKRNRQRREENAAEDTNSITRQDKLI
jgi:hypothetical protein